MSDAAELAIWRGLDAWRVEAAAVELSAKGLAASGTQIASDPVAYRLDYRLDASDGFLTRALTVTARGRGWRRELELRHDGHGAWTCEGRGAGDLGLPAPGGDAAALAGALDCDLGLPAPGGDAAALAGALDCDLGLSPLTNLMPIRRLGLHRRSGAEGFVMAWVSVPDLAVVASRQRYEHVRTTVDGSIVRYVDRGLFDGFTAELELDRDGLVVRYPELAERVGDEPSEP